MISYINNIMEEYVKKIKEIPLRFYEQDNEIIEKLKKLKKVFNEKTDNKTIKKIIKEFEIK